MNPALHLAGRVPRASPPAPGPPAAYRNEGVARRRRSVGWSTSHAFVPYRDRSRGRRRRRDPRGIGRRAAAPDSARPRAPGQHRRGDLARLRRVVAERRREPHAAAGLLQPERRGGRDPRGRGQPPRAGRWRQGPTDPLPAGPELGRVLDHGARGPGGAEADLDGPGQQPALGDRVLGEPRLLHRPVSEPGERQRAPDAAHRGRRGRAAGAAARGGGHLVDHGRRAARVAGPR